MDKTYNPKIGLVTNSDCNRQILRQVLVESGYEPSFTLTSSELIKRFEEEQDSCTDIHHDAWLIDVDDSDAQQVLEVLSEHCELPLLVNEHVPNVNEVEAYQRWHRRLLEKLELVAIPREYQHEEVLKNTRENFSQVWVLAASFGGPDAVREFLQALPEGLPLAMVYGQHIEQNFERFLTKGIGGNHSYAIHLITSEYKLCAGEVAVVPVDRQLRFSSRGHVVGTRRSWQGQYQPVLDQVISDLARIYRSRLGVIIFSGLCNDGEVGCRVAKACGSKVWVQAPETCLSADMPNAALSTGCVSFQGSPEQLAVELAKQLQEVSPIADKQSAVKG